MRYLYLLMASLFLLSCSKDNFTPDQEKYDDKSIIPIYLQYRLNAPSRLYVLSYTKITSITPSDGGIRLDLANATEMEMSLFQKYVPDMGSDLYYFYRIDLKEKDYGDYDLTIMNKTGRFVYKVTFSLWYQFQKNHELR